MSEIKKPSLLDTYGTDYTQLARESKLDDVIGREYEIKKLVQTLSRRKKNNVILTGQAGVGKTALINGLAQKIVNQEVSPLLENKKIIELDISALISGTKYRGQFEERIKGIMLEIEQDPNIILFIDEIHTIIGTGNSSGALDIANMLKPALASGKIQLIGATTNDEYDKSIRNDGALERRFQKINIAESSELETIQILKSIKSYYENHHSVSYSNEVIEHIVKLANRYITNRSFPDKAIDILDETGSLIHIKNVVFPQHIKDLQQLKIDVEQEKFLVVRQQKFEAAAKLRDKEQEILTQIHNETDIWKVSYKNNIINVTLEDVSEVVSSMVDIPVTKIGLEENKRLLELPIELNKKIIGQANAVKSVAKAIQKARLDIKKNNKPCSLFFLGTSGVGKTLLAKELSKYLFDSDDALIRINMNEYSEKISTSRLIGGSPGYVGYEEGGELTKKIRNKPYSVLLLDEIEKAHPDVMDIFLQVLDEGYLNDAKGHRIDFRHTIIIMTSNIGTKVLKDFGLGIGYGKSKNVVKDIEIQNILKKELEKTLKPEVLNRLDNIIYFNELKKEDLGAVVDIYLEKLIAVLDEKGYKVSFNDEVKQEIVNIGYDARYGARVIERTISTMIEDTLTDLLLDGVTIGSKIYGVLEDKKVVYIVTKSTRRSRRKN